MPRPLKVNTAWFKTRLEVQGIDQKRLAEALKLEPSAVTRILQGKRKLQLREATEIARLFSTPIEEVLKNAGLKEAGDVESSGSITVSGWIGADYSVHFGAGVSGPSGPLKVPLPAFGGRDMKVLRYQTTGTALETLDGALVYFKPVETVPAEAIGRLCVLKVHGGWLLGVPKRGYEPGVYNITAMDSTVLRVDAVLDSASPVVWIRI